MRVLWDFPDPQNAWQSVTHETAVPREGEAVVEGVEGEEEFYRVRHVIWYPFGDEQNRYVQVILRREETLS